MEVCFYTRLFWLYGFVLVPVVKSRILEVIFMMQTEANNGIHRVSLCLYDKHFVLLVFFFLSLNYTYVQTVCTIL